MDITSCTVTVPVADLERARAWYGALLGREEADLEPAPGIVEFEVGGCWVQLAEATTGDARWVLRIGVSDVEAERQRLLGLGIDVEEPVEIEDVIVYCDFRDPDGNRLSLYSVFAT